MIQVFYKSKGQILTTSDVKELTENLGFDDVLWIDLYEPDRVETQAVEEFLETTLQSRAQADDKLLVRRGGFRFLPQYS